MAKRHGKDGVVKIGANTMKTTKWTLTETGATSDDTDMGDPAETHQRRRGQGAGGEMGCAHRPT